MTKVLFCVLPLSKLNVLIKKSLYLLQRNFIKNIKSSGNFMPFEKKSNFFFVCLQTSTETV